MIHVRTHTLINNHGYIHTVIQTYLETTYTHFLEQNIHTYIHTYILYIHIKGAQETHSGVRSHRDGGTSTVLGDVVHGDEGADEE
jgi:hypothetical protein